MVNLGLNLKVSLYQNLMHYLEQNQLKERPHLILMQCLEQNLYLMQNLRLG